MTVELTPETEAYITKKIADGSYSSPAAVIEAAVRLLQEQDATEARRLLELRRELDRGSEQAGRCELINGEAFMRELRHR